MQVKLSKDMTADRGHIFAKGSIVDFMTKVSKAGVVQIMPVDAVDEQGLPYVNAGRDTIYQLEVQASDYTVLDKDVELKKMSFNYPNSYIEKDDDDTITASLVDLYADKDFMLDADGLVSKKAQNEKEEAILNEHATKVWENENWIVFTPDTYEASCILGRGTSWCTATKDYPNQYKSHTAKGKLWIAINKQNPQLKFQYHFETNQFKNASDREVDKNQMREKYPDLMEGLFGTVEKHYTSGEGEEEKTAKKKTAEAQDNMLVGSDEDITTDFDPAVGGSEKGVDEAMKNQIANPDESTKPVTDLFSNPLTAGIKKLEEMKETLAKEDNNLVGSDEDITTDFDPAVGGSGKLPAYPHGESASEGWKDKYLGETL